MRIEYLDRSLEVCSPFPMDESPLSWISTGKDPIFRVSVRSYHSYRVFPERRVIYVPPERWYPYTAYGLRYMLARDYEGGFLLHAGAVSGGSGAILFVGRSGSGKTRAVGSALRRGFAYMGEDMVVLKGGRVFMHIPFTLNPPEFVREDRPRRICFIRYSPGAYPVILRLSPARAMPLLLEQIFNLGSVFSRVGEIERMLEEVDILYVMYSDFSEVEESCLY